MRVGASARNGAGSSISGASIPRSAACRRTRSMNLLWPSSPKATLAARSSANSKDPLPAPSRRPTRVTPKSRSACLEVERVAAATTRVLQVGHQSLCRVGQCLDPHVEEAGLLCPPHDVVVAEPARQPRRAAAGDDDVATGLVGAPPRSGRPDWPDPTISSAARRDPIGVPISGYVELRERGGQSWRRSGDATAGKRRKRARRAARACPRQRSRPRTHPAARPRSHGRRRPANGLAAIAAAYRSMRVTNSSRGRKPSLSAARCTRRPGSWIVQFGVTRQKLSHRSRHDWPIRPRSSTRCSTPRRASSRLVPSPAWPAPTTRTFTASTLAESNAQCEARHRSGSVCTIAREMQEPIHDVFDQFKQQLPDIDPVETG